MLRSVIPKASGSGFFVPEEEGVPGNSLAAALSGTHVGVQALKLGSSRHTLVFCALEVAAEV